MKLCRKEGLQAWQCVKRSLFFGCIHSRQKKCDSVLFSGVPLRQMTGQWKIRFHLALKRWCCEGLIDSADQRQNDQVLENAAMIASFSGWLLFSPFGSTANNSLPTLQSFVLIHCQCLEIQNSPLHSSQLVFRISAAYKHTRKRKRIRTARIEINRKHKDSSTRQQSTA